MKEQNIIKMKIVTSVLFSLISSIDNNWVYRRISQLVIIQRRVGRSCCFSVDAEKRMDYQKFTGQAGGAHHQ